MHQKLKTSTNLWQLIIINQGVRSLLEIDKKEKFGKKNWLNQ